MKKALFAVLTSLFVFVMTVVPSYAQQPAPAGDCTTVEMVLATIGESLKAKGGSSETLSEKDTATFIQSVMDDMGQSPPFAISKILIVTPEPDSEVLAIGYFDGNCLQGSPAAIPAILVQRLLRRTPA